MKTALTLYFQTKTHVAKAEYASLDIATYHYLSLIENANDPDLKGLRIISRQKFDYITKGRAMFCLHHSMIDDNKTVCKLMQMCYGT